MELNGGRSLEFDGGSGIKVHVPRPGVVAVTESSASRSVAPHVDKAAESMWHMSFRAGEYDDYGPYPERPGEPECAYFIKTGLCRFGVTCRFNHPPNRQMAVARMMGGYPERVGQLECQYYLKTGTCKFGPTCKFHHPKDNAGITGRVPLNILGYPLRPNEKECAYYLRTGQCKFSNTCKFHHPQPSNAMLWLHSTVYPFVHSRTTPGQQSFTGELTNWPLSKASFIASPRWQGPSSYAQLVVPQELVQQVPSWNTIPGQLLSASSHESHQQYSRNDQLLGTSHQSETTAASSASFQFGSAPIGPYVLQRDSIFPERPGERECQFYMKTGDCKFGALCRFHHPRERTFPAPNCMLSSLGLPLRPGEPLCIFYSRYGICKFGPNCKFDHPMTSTTMGIFPYDHSMSSSPDVPVVRRLLGSSSGRTALSLSSETSLQAGPVKSRHLSLSGSLQMNSTDDNLESE